MIRVLVVDDDPLVRAGLAMILGAAEDIEVVGEAADGAGITELCQQVRPDVVLMDIRMPRVDGLAATHAVRALDPAPAVLVMTTFHLDAYVFGALEAGATGFLLKDTPPRRIIEGIREVAEGRAILSPEDTHALVTRYASGATDGRARQARRRMELLSEREVEIALLVAEGLSNAEIAAGLVIAEATVKAHVSHIFTKLGLENRVQVAILAYRAGLLD